MKDDLSLCRWIDISEALERQSKVCAEVVMEARLAPPYRELPRETASVHLPSYLYLETADLPCEGDSVIIHYKTSENSYMQSDPGCIVDVARERGLLQVHVAWGRYEGIRSFVRGGNVLQGRQQYVLMSDVVLGREVCGRTRRSQQGVGMTDKMDAGRRGAGVFRGSLETQSMANSSVMLDTVAGHKSSPVRSKYIERIGRKYQDGLGGVWVGDAEGQCLKLYGVPYHRGPIDHCCDGFTTCYGPKGRVASERLTELNWVRMHRGDVTLECVCVGDTVIADGVEGVVESKGVDFLWIRRHVGDLVCVGWNQGKSVRVVRTSVDKEREEEEERRREQEEGDEEVQKVRRDRRDLENRRRVLEESGNLNAKSRTPLESVQEAFEQPENIGDKTSQDEVCIRQELAYMSAIRQEAKKKRQMLQKHGHLLVKD